MSPLHRPPFRLPGLVLALILGATSGTPVQAAEPDRATADWELTGLSEPATQLFTPLAGQLFATVQTASDDGAASMQLERSDDAGQSWSSFSLPDATYRVAVHPITPASVLAAVADEAGTQVLRTGDVGKTWNKTDLNLPKPDMTIQALAFSPADAQVVYLEAGLKSWRSLKNSQSGGQSWLNLVSGVVSASCDWTVNLLATHPTDSNRVYLSDFCSDESTLNSASPAPLMESKDRGQSFKPIFSPENGVPTQLAVGRDKRLFAADQSLTGERPGSLYRSDDDGATWKPILTLETVEGDTQPQFHGLVTNPFDMDRVYFAAGPCPGCSVQGSTDGGLTWQPLGGTDISDVVDLALSADRRYLFAATSSGVWRFPTGTT